MTSVSSVVNDTRLKMFRNNKQPANGDKANGKLNDDGTLIKLRDVRKIYETSAVNSN